MNVHHAIGIAHPDYQPILIASDVEYDSTVFDNAGVLEILFGCGRGCPIGLQRMPIPGKSRLHGINISGIAFPEYLQRGQRDDSHSANDSPVPGLMQALISLACLF